MPAKYKHSFNMPDPASSKLAIDLGPLPGGNKVQQSVKMNGADTVYDVNYSIDNFNRRITPNHINTKPQYAMFFGCSITYGEGVQDNETLPFYFQELSDTCNAYNYAYSGNGTSQMLARFETQDVRKQVWEEHGRCFYVFFWDHIYRSIGSMNTYVGWLWSSPYYKMENGQLVRAGSFKTGRKVVSKFYESVYQSSIIKYFNINFPLKLNSSHYELVAEMMIKSKELYNQQFKDDPFYVVIYPFYNWCTAEQMNEFKEVLTKKNIQFIDLTDISYNENYDIKGDKHPNPVANQMLATELWKRVQEIEGRIK